MKPVRCKKCKVLMLSVEKDARKNHLMHTCFKCNRMLEVQPACACKLLAHFSPELQSDNVYLARLPQLAATANSLEVDPTFLQRVSDATFDENDREMRTIVTHEREWADNQYFVQQYNGVPLVYRKHNAVQSALVIPSGEGLKRILMWEAHHGSGGHLGTRKTAEYLYSRVQWPRLVPLVAEFVHGCTAFQQNKDRTQLPQGFAPTGGDSRTQISHLYDGVCNKFTYV